jgi:hypothetical protein
MKDRLKPLPMPAPDGAPYRCYKYTIQGKTKVPNTNLMIDNWDHCNNRPIGRVPKTVSVKLEGSVVCQEHYDELLADVVDDKE